MSKKLRHVVIMKLLFVSVWLERETTVRTTQTLNGLFRGDGTVDVGTA